jgi:hypothetical protein
VDFELILYKGIPVNPISGPNFTTVIGGDIRQAAYADLLRLNTGIPPNNALTDGVDRNPEGFLPNFPYLQTPYSGFDSPHSVRAQ